MNALLNSGFGFVRGNHPGGAKHGDTFVRTTGNHG